MARVALVTGGAKGIGAATVRRLASSGYDVAINYASSAAQAEELAAELVAGGRRAVALQADVSDAEQARALIDDVARTLGPVSTLVNNAAIHNSRTVLKQSPEEWDRAVAVNLSAAFYCTHFALPAMYEAEWGRVVFIGSDVQRNPFPGDAVYGATKAALTGMAGCLALETYAYGITVNTVIPGFVLTDLTRSIAPHVLEAIKEEATEVTADDVAAVIQFVCSEDARAVNGEVIGAPGAGARALKKRAPKA